MTYRSVKYLYKSHFSRQIEKLFHLCKLVFFQRFNTATVMDDTKEPSSPEPDSIIVSETRCGRCCRLSKALFVSCFPRFFTRSHQAGTSLRATDVPLPLSKRRVNPNISIESFCKAKKELFAVWEQTEKRHIEAAIDVSQEAEVLN